MAFECDKCAYKTKYIVLYNKHLYIHREDTQFSCMWPNCLKKMSQYSSYKSHWHICHSKFLKKETRGSIAKKVNYNCHLCQFQTKEFSEIIIHMRNHIKAGEEIICPVKNCKLHFTNLSSFRSHCFRKHRSFTMNKMCSSTHNNNERVNLDVPAISENVQLHKEAENGYENLFHTLKYSYTVQDTVLHFLHSELTKILKIKEMKILENINMSHNNEFKDIIHNIFDYSSLNSLKDSFHRKKIIEAHENYVPISEINLGRDNFHKKCNFSYVSILATLSNLLQDVNFKNIISKDSTNNKLLDYNDGSIYMANQFFNDGAKKLELLFFQDGFEICNPLGSSKGKHKLIGLYMVIGNINKKYRNLIKNIQLVLLCKESNIKIFGYDKILKPLVRDLKILETDGIKIGFTDENRTNIFKGSIFAMIGDNLGSHQIGGFTENFSKSEYFCRYCLYTRDSLKKRNMEICEFRTHKNYDDCIEKLLKQENLIEKGIKANSILNSLNYFHVCNLGLPPCLSHDLFEGFIPFDLMDILSYFNTKEIFNFNNLNIFLTSIRSKFKLKLSFPMIRPNMKKVP